MVLRVRRRRPVMLAAVASLITLPGCWFFAPSNGGGEHVEFNPPRAVEAADVALPAGYRIEAVATGLNMPTSVAFDDSGRPHVLEAGYAYGEVWATPRLLRLEPDGRTTEIACGDNPPWNGLSYHRGAFFVGEGGQKSGGRILRITPDGRVTPLVTGLPSLGDHHTNRPVVGPDGMVYFGQGTATNSGVVGPDNFEFGWAKRHPGFHDVPGRDVTLAGENFRSANPMTPDDPHDQIATGAYVPFGTTTVRGQRIPGRLPCTGAIMRVGATGGPLELVAWGLRNPYSLAFAPDGTLYATENGADERGSRPIYGAPDVLWAIRKGRWYGWPDYVAGVPVTDQRFNQSPGNPQLTFVLAEHPETPPKPAAELGVHSSSNGLDFSRSPAFGHVGEAFVAQFGDMAGNVGKVLWPVGFKVVRVNPATGVTEEFAANRGDQVGPASRTGGGGFERPVDVRFNPAGDALYVVDFGVLTMGRGPEPRQGTGVLWRITRTGR